MAFVAKHIFSLVTNQWGEAYVRGAAVSGCPAGGSVTTLFSWTDNSDNSASWSSHAGPAGGVGGLHPELRAGDLAAGLCPAPRRQGRSGRLRQLSSQPVARETSAFVCPCLSSQSMALAWRGWGGGVVPNPTSPGGEGGAGGGCSLARARLRSAAGGAGLCRAPSRLCWLEHHQSPRLQAPPRWSTPGSHGLSCASLGSNLCKSELSSIFHCLLFTSVCLCRIGFI